VKGGLMPTLQNRYFCHSEFISESQIIFLQLRNLKSSIINQGKGRGAHYVLV